MNSAALVAPFGIAPNADVAAVLQWAAVGALIGTALAARRRIRNPKADVALPPMLWSVFFAVLAVLVVLLEALP